MSTTAEAKKPTTITVTLTVTYPAAKEAMNFSDFAAEGTKAEKIRDAVKAFGAVEGECVIGKQKFKL